MVKKLRLGEDLQTLGLRVASNTATYRVITQAVGAEKARSLVTEELSKARPKYQDRWDANLAASYAAHLSTEELQSMSDKQRQSPHFQKFMAKQNDVGAIMKSKSQGLLSAFVAEGLTNAFQKVAPKK
jgi:hypothetical protein